MSAKEFFVQLPYLCKAKNADRYSRKNALVWEDEMANPSGVFAKNADDVDDPFNRIAMAYDFEGDAATIAYCMDLGELLLLSHYQVAHDEDHKARIGVLWKDLAEMEMDYPEVSKVLSVEQALEGVWTP